MLRLLAALTLLTHAAQAQSLESRVQGLEIVPLSDLAATLPPIAATWTCSDQFGHRSINIEAFAKVGLVTHELPFGEMTAVSLEPPGGNCDGISGSVVFFRGDRQVAILNVMDEDRKRFELIEPIDDARLRLVSVGNHTIHLADLHADANGGIAVLPPVEEQPFCDGKVQVPNIYDLPLQDARDRIFRDGWRPMPTPNIDPDEPGFSFPDIEGDEFDFYLANWNDEGILEPGFCYLAEYAYCLFRYAQPGAVLEVKVDNLDGPAYRGRVVRTKVKCY